MKLTRIVRAGVDGLEPRVAVVLPDEHVVVDLVTAERARLERSGSTEQAATRIARALFPSSMAAAIAAGDVFLESARRVLEDRQAEGRLRWDEVEWTSPVDPPVMLDGSAFEQHLVNAHARGKRDVPDLFYEVPVYYKMNPQTVIGHEAEVPWRGEARFMDYELELGIVVGKWATDLRPEESLPHIFGITAMNDFSARDVQAREMTAGFGPAKGKDFATALGPWITTMDEVDLSDLEMVARVNGEEWSRGSTSSLMWSVEELVAFASRGETIVAGEVIGTGTVGLGCGLELYRKLKPGDVVEIEISSIGVLRNTIGHPEPSRWTPKPKERRAQVIVPPREDRAG
jgi:2-keto-4-pentenoate hydratase/2-oxohepta-3-ene-1,7-dioic acid hydratase in catechol pathway